MPKNIVLLLDGTSNEIKENRTNILRLYGSLVKDESQLVYYDPGVGTLGGNAWLRLWRKFVEIWGLITGYGLDKNVLEAYRFLIENYDDGKRVEGEDEAADRIFIFGFSRGAYTARVLAGFLHAIGMIEERNLNLLPYAFRAYKQADTDKKDSFEEINLYRRTLQTEQVAVQCLGLFDTVSSLIEWNGLLPRLKSYVYTSTNTSVISVRHAVAIDERRTMFRADLWDMDVSFVDKREPENIRKQDSKEVWFAGVHGDVGGGYPEKESGLAKIPLSWMIEETRAEGLDFNQHLVDKLVLGKGQDHYCGMDASGKLHDSMTPAWSILEFLPRLKPKDSRRPSFLGFTIPLFEPRHIPEGAYIHQSVFDRKDAVRYDPPNLPEDFRVEPWSKV